MTKETSINEIKQARIIACNEMLKIVQNFEAEYGENTIIGLGLSRWNGSNNAFGKISAVNFNISFSDL